MTNKRSLEDVHATLRECFADLGFVPCDLDATECGQPGFYIARASNDGGFRETFARVQTERTERGEKTTIDLCSGNMWVEICAIRR